METKVQLLVEVDTLSRSYPTYEEWKHDLFVECRRIDFGSYPTYEEWKPT